MRLEQALEGGDAYVREIHRPRHYARRTDRLEGGEGGAQRPNRLGGEIGVFDDEALVGGERGSDTRRVGAEHYDAGLYVQRLQGLEDADGEGPAPEVQECLGPTHSFRGPGSEHHPGETHAVTLSRVAPRRQTPKLAAHGRTTHPPAGRPDPATPLRAGPEPEIRRDAARRGRSPGFARRRQEEVQDGTGARGAADRRAGADRVRPDGQAALDDDQPRDHGRRAGRLSGLGRLLLVSQPARARDPGLPDHGELYRPEGQAAHDGGPGTDGGAAAARDRPPRWHPGARSRERRR